MEQSWKTYIGELLKRNKAAQCGELVFIFGISVGLIIALFVPMVGKNQMLVQLVVWTANMVLIFLVWFSQWLRGESLSELGLQGISFRWKAIARNLLISLLILVLGLLAFQSGLLLMPVPEKDLSPEISVNYDYLKQNPAILILSLLGVYMVSSFGEELVYRGYLINRLLQLYGESRSGKLMAAITSAIIFGAIHYQWGFTGMVQTSLMGLVFALAFMIMKNRLLPLILAHAFMDTILLVSIYYN